MELHNQQNTENLAKDYAARNFGAWWSGILTEGERATHAGLQERRQMSTSGLLWLCHWVLGSKLALQTLAVTWPFGAPFFLAKNGFF